MEQTSSSVHRFSFVKILTAILFVALPFLGFWLGREYEMSVTPTDQNNSPQTIQQDNRCSLVPDPGTCKAYVPSFYFDQIESECKQFIWGVCGGTRPFTKLKDCQSACQSVQWKTFTSKVIPFELQAPLDWQLTESAVPEMFNQKTVIISSTDFRYEGGQVAEGYSIQIGPISNRGIAYISFEQFAQERNSDGKAEIVVFQGEKWLKYSTQALTLYNSVPIAVSISYAPQREETGRMIFNQILSTFRFVGKSSI